jgi:hypothetical protein
VSVRHAVIAFTLLTCTIPLPKRSLRGLRTRTLSLSAHTQMPWPGGFWPLTTFAQVSFGTKPTSRDVGSVGAKGPKADIRPSVQKRRE